MYHEIFLIYSPLEFLRCTVPVFDMHIFYCVDCECNSMNFLSIIIYCIVKANCAKNNNLTLLQVL